MSKVLGLKFAESTVEITALFAGHHFCIEAQMCRRRVVTSQPTDSSQDSQTAKDSQNRDKEVFVPHSVTIGRLGKRKRNAILLDLVPKEHNTF